MTEIKAISLMGKDSSIQTPIQNRTNDHKIHPCFLSVVVMVAVWSEAIETGEFFS